jgi:hypothetical protein
MNLKTWMGSTRLGSTGTTGLSMVLVGRVAEERGDLGLDPRRIHVAHHGDGQIRRAVALAEMVDQLAASEAGDRLGVPMGSSR